jgi:hypothetical protein
MGEVAGHDVVYTTTMVWNEFRAMADLLRAHVGKVADQGLTLNAITKATQVRPPPISSFYDPKILCYAGSFPLLVYVLRD